MAGPITWQNVNGASLADAFRPMQGAAASMNGAFDTLQSTLKERQALDADNWKQGKQNNTDAYLAKLAILGKTPESLQAAMESGELDTLQAGYGAQVDQKQIRGAAESMLDERYKQVKMAGEFDAYQRKEMQKPIAQDIAGRIAAGEHDLAASLINENRFLDNAAELSTMLNGARRAKIEAKYADNEEGRRQADQELQKLAAADQRATNAAQRAAAASSIANGRADRADRNSDRKEARGDKLMGILGDLRVEEGAIRADYAGSSVGLKVLNDAADKMSSPKLKMLARRAITENSKLPGMTVGALMAGINAMEDSDWTPTLESTYATRVKLAAAEHLKSPEALAQQSARVERSKRVAELEMNTRAKLGLGRE